jgi:hypothetical protein
MTMTKISLCLFAAFILFFPGAAFSEIAARSPPPSKQDAKLTITEYARCPARAMDCTSECGASTSGTSSGTSVRTSDREAVLLVKAEDLLKWLVTVKPDGRDGKNFIAQEFRRVELGKPDKAGKREARLWPKEPRGDCIKETLRKKRLAGKAKGVNKLVELEGCACIEIELVAPSPPKK